jgi:YD repeat-containing protein
VDENGRITEKNSKPNTANPTKTLYTYDEKGRMTSEKTSNKGVTVSSKTYTWNSDGTYDVAIRNNGVLDQITKFNASGLPTRADNYQSGKVIYYTESKYDASDRLVKAEYYLNGNLKGSLSYEYNVHGDVTVEKKSKNGVVEQDIIPMIRKLEIGREDGETVLLDALICCQNPTLNPMQMVTAIAQELPELNPSFAYCRRIEIYDAEESVFR